MGNRHILEATAEGTVTLETLLPDSSFKKYKLENVLRVPKPSYSWLSLSKAGKTTRFDKFSCEIVNKGKKVIAFATRVGNLYYLEYCRKAHSVNAVEGNKERL